MAGKVFSKRTSDTTGEVGIAYISGTVRKDVPAVRWEVVKNDRGSFSVWFAYVYYAWACANPEHPDHIRRHPISWEPDFLLHEVMAEAEKLARSYTLRHAVID